MKSVKGVSFLFIFLFLAIPALALLVSACGPVSVPPWPYTTETDDAAAPTDDGGSDDGSWTDASEMDDTGMSGAGGIQATYGPVPLRCDGGLCNTDNRSLCNVAGGPAESGAGGPFSTLIVVAGLAIAWKRSRRREQRSS